MRLHPQEILVTFLRLMHLGIAFTFLVLGRAGCVDDGGVDNGALAQRQALVPQVNVGGFQDARRQLMLLQQVPKIHDRCVFGNRRAERQTSKLTHRSNLVQRLFNENQFCSR